MSSTESTTPHGVAVVVDGSFGDSLAVLAARIHVWAIDTPANRTVAETIWQESGGTHSLEAGVTLFRGGSDLPPDSTVAGVLGTVDLHHGEYSHRPPWSYLEVYGALLTVELAAALEEFGFTDRETRQDRLVARRRVEDAG